MSYINSLLLVIEGANQEQKWFYINMVLGPQITSRYQGRSDVFFILQMRRQVLRVSPNWLQTQNRPANSKSCVFPGKLIDPLLSPFIVCLFFFNIIIIVLFHKVIIILCHKKHKYYRTLNVSLFFRIEGSIQMMQHLIATIVCEFCLYIWFSHH